MAGARMRQERQPQARHHDKVPFEAVLLALIRLRNLARHRHAVHDRARCQQRQAVKHCVDVILHSHTARQLREGRMRLVKREGRMRSVKREGRMRSVKREDACGAVAVGC
eukprot:357579-Chlamydomonas_euryale.AAC.5